MEKLIALMNLGTPQAPTPEKVAPYLREFLMDGFVIDLPYPLRWFLVNCIIVPFRKKASSANYQLVWTERGSPLRFHMNDLRDAMAKQLSTDAIEVFMRYGQGEWEIGETTAEIDLVPLYPHYAESSYRTAIEEALKQLPESLKVRVLKPFFRHPEFIKSLVQSVKEPIQGPLILSYHGLPERHIRKTDFGQTCFQTDCCDQFTKNNQWCYRAQCFETSRQVAKGLGVTDFHTTFQSRLGRDKWLTPSTESQLVELAQQGVGEVTVIAPSFTIDCLETLQEIQVELKDEFIHAGGKKLNYVPCLNAQEHWVQGLEKILADSNMWWSRDQYRSYTLGKLSR